METVNQKIIDAVIEKAKMICPGSLALIGIYGSVSTGDAYAKSDLDLLILIQNEDGWKLATGFILDDHQVGYDIYCTSWDSLKHDAQCHHAHLSKLLDSQIVYVQNQAAYEALLRLRSQVKDFLASEERFQKVTELISKAKTSYADACLYDDLGQVRLAGYGVIDNLLDAVMLYHGRYFKRGVKRTFEELAALPLDAQFADTIRKVPVSKDIGELRDLLKSLILYAEKHTRFDNPKFKPSAALAGTYEEMFSNWRNKVEEAAKNKDAFSSFANMCGFQLMLTEIAEENEIGTFPILDAYSADSLEENVRTFDQYLQKYEEVYTRAGIRVKRFADVDTFVENYLRE